MSGSGAVLDDTAFMTAFLDVLIPPSGSGRLPGAGSLGLATDLAKALQPDATLGPLVEAGVQAVREAALSGHPEGLSGMAAQERANVVEGQLATHPFLVMAVLRYLYPAYYQQPEVLEGIGEAPRPPFPEGFDVEPTDPELLEGLRSRRRKS